MFGVTLGQVLFMTTAGTVLSRALNRSALQTDPSGQQPRSVGNSIPQVGGEGNANMSYDIIGDDDLYDDDDVGAIGAVLIGDDDDDDDYIGDDDDDLVAELVSGDGMSEIIGARRQRGRRTRGRRVARRIASRGSMVVKRNPSRKRRYPLGFTPTDIATTLTSNIPSAPQSLFRPERLIIPSEIAPDIGVTDIKVGTQSQFAQNTEVPAAVFSEVAIGAEVHFDSAEVGNQVYVSARNKSGSTVNFTAALIGTVAK